MIKQVPMARFSLRQVSHADAGVDPAGLGIALEVARELHTPTRPRPPEVTVVPQLMGLRMSSAHPHRRKVPLSRLSKLPG
ncbi:hypothetical protein [Streptomyces sp. NPDC058475]|uniref:hypothetical protein n=1 Tax=unclassified Streptomyces TaxID=2593676 RepID=UPI003660F5E3